MTGAYGFETNMACDENNVATCLTSGNPDNVIVCTADTKCCEASGDELQNCFDQVGRYPCSGCQE